MCFIVNVLVYVCVCVLISGWRRVEIRGFSDLMGIKKDLKEGGR